jgi:hypothetical protein
MVKTNQVKPWYNVWQSEPTPTCVMQDEYIHVAPCKMDELWGQEKNLQCIPNP